MKSVETLLVTGAAGFIGSTFVRQMVAQGRKVIGLDALTYAGHRENLEDISGRGRFELVVGNICDGALVTQLLNHYSVDALINFAAESHVDRSILIPSAFIETNINGVFVLLNAALQYWQGLPVSKKNGFRFLQVSTDEVYGSLGSTGQFNENTPYAPNSPYSASKASGDLLVRAWHHTYGLPTLITNCSNNYGPRQYPEKLIPNMITCSLMNRPLPVYGDGRNVRDWIHVEDHTVGIGLALDRGIPGASYCFGGRSERNNLEVVQAICLTLDQLSPRVDGKSHAAGIVFVPDRLGHDHRYAIDDALAERELGFTRSYPCFEVGLSSTVRWYLDHQDWSKLVTQKKL